MRANIHPSSPTQGRAHTQEGFRGPSQPNVHVFGLVQETGVPEESAHADVEENI